MPARPPWLEAEKLGPPITRSQGRWLVVLATAFVAIFLYWTILATIALVAVVHDADQGSNNGSGSGACLNSVIC
jgi:hypothetical protein